LGLERGKNMKKVEKVSKTAKEAKVSNKAKISKGSKGSLKSCTESTESSKILKSKISSKSNGSKVVKGVNGGKKISRVKKVKDTECSERVCVSGDEKVKVLSKTGKVVKGGKKIKNIQRGDILVSGCCGSEVVDIVSSVSTESLGGENVEKRGRGRPKVNKYKDDDIVDMSMVKMYKFLGYCPMCKGIVGSGDYLVDGVTLSCVMCDWDGIVGDLLLDRGGIGRAKSKREFLESVIEVHGDLEDVGHISPDVSILGGFDIVSVIDDSSGVLD
jgi:hypothetical protein